MTRRVWSPRRGTRRRRTALPSLALLVTFGLTAGHPLAAHDTENTHVQATFSDGTYRIDVLNDPGWLWLLLAPGAGSVVPDFEERDRQLRGLTTRFGNEIRVFFDGVPTDVDRIEYVAPDAHDPTAPGWGEPGMFRLWGTVPPGAERFQFAYSLVVDQYPMTVSVDGGTPLTRWLLTGERSEAFVLASLKPLTRHIGMRQVTGLNQGKVDPVVHHKVGGIALTSPRCRITSRIGEDERLPNAAYVVVDLGLIGNCDAGTGADSKSVLRE